MHELRRYERVQLAVREGSNQGDPAEGGIQPGDRMTGEREQVLQFVREVHADTREREPLLFTPQGAQIPYVWAALSGSSRWHGATFERACEATIALARDEGLRALYAAAHSTTHTNDWVSQQVQNIARRSMMSVGTAQAIDESFAGWWPLFVREINRKTSSYFSIHEVHGANVPRGRVYPIRFRDESSIRVWFQEGELAQVAVDLGVPLPPSLWRADWRSKDERPDSIAVSAHIQPKDKDSLDWPGRGLLSQDLFGYRRAAQLATGIPVEFGRWISGEASPFPVEDVNLFAHDLRHWAIKRPLINLDRQTHSRIRELQPRIEQWFTEAWTDSTAFRYSLMKFERMVEEERYWWSDAVVDAVSVLDTVFGASERNAPVANRAAWLAGLGEKESRELRLRILHLFRARNRIIHSGSISDSDFIGALAALGVRASNPTANDPSPEWKHQRLWDETAAPRLRELVRWSIEVGTTLRRIGSGKVGWPVSSNSDQRSIDTDILFGVRTADWRKPLRKIPSPMRAG